jgi:sodium/hydrogen antiporter
LVGSTTVLTPRSVRLSGGEIVLKLAVVVLVLVAYAVASRRLESRISGPMAFLTVGIVVSEPGLDWFTFELGEVTIEILLKGSLALVLFIEASNLGSRRVRAAQLPGRLLLVAMPLVIVGGVVAALGLFPALSFWETVVLAALLAPTDASLGLPVVENEKVPARIRDALVIEGGLNDGMAVPFALFAAGAAEVTAGTESTPELYKLLVGQIGVAVLVGIAAGWIGAKVLGLATDRGWATDGWMRLAVVGVAVITFAIAEGSHGSGFIAAWVAGVTFGLVGDDALVRPREFSDQMSQLLVSLAFLIVGALAVGPQLADLSWQIVVYAILALALIRPVAVGLSLLGRGEKFPTVAFLGWFGPRGLPSVVLGLILLTEGFDLPSGQLIIDVVVFTVAMSVYVHGVSAEPLSQRYARWCERDSAA